MHHLGTSYIPTPSGGVGIPNSEPSKPEAAPAPPIPQLIHDYKTQPPATEFEWSTQEEPHKSRRKVILAKYPQLKELFRPDPLSGLLCLCTVLAQFVMLYVIQFHVESWALFVALAWVVGGTLNASLELAAHELSHDLFFPWRSLNRWCGYLACLPTGVASSATFKRYHLMHHSSQGLDVVDADIPTNFEAKLYRGKLGKLAFIFLQVFSYALRPSLTNPLVLSSAEITGWIVALSFNALVYTFLGGKAILYMFASDLFGLGLHPISGHFISEHYVFLPTKKEDGGSSVPMAETGQETHSYYGCLNYLCYNVGYHNEHHDFPRVPGRLLPRVTETAKEYYDLPHYTSWVRVLWDFVMCDHITLHSRVKRRRKPEEEETKKAQ
eukprot:GEMP01038017.1.p1 GENE.GEMP01038017.1~~GEMP01038017.1.p1  ORF type:complete len:382 (+),score=74.80 GEMP01038017.1:156-1301(+)